MNILKKAMSGVNNVMEQNNTEFASFVKTVDNRIRGSSNKEWDFLHSLKICDRIKLKVTTIIEQHLSNSEMEPMFL